MSLSVEGLLPLFRSGHFQTRNKSQLGHLVAQFSSMNSKASMYPQIGITYNYYIVHKLVEFSLGMELSHKHIPSYHASTVDLKCVLKTCMWRFSKICKIDSIYTEYMQNKFVIYVVLLQHYIAVGPGSFQWSTASNYYNNTKSKSPTRLTCCICGYYILKISICAPMVLCRG